MGKSSSLKKKRSKNSSQLRTRKKNKVKSKKSKSKKLRKLRHDSVSNSGDGDSISMVSVSSSSSEDNYRSRKSRSRDRKDVKVGKKRARRLSSSRESSEDSHYVKKRRGSKRDDSDTRKRTGKRKKSRRDVSVSSQSSRSFSCSTSPSDGDKIGYEKRRGRSEKKEKHGSRSEKVKRGGKRSKGQSRSSSSCSRYNDGSDHSIEEGVMEESNSRRLKSIITVVKQENESSREFITDDPKEDVYDYDDYPSCRSNDSNDGCSRKELQQHPLTVSAAKGSPDDEQVEASNIGKSNVEEINVPSATGGLNGDDIESILRQRALENLKKFRDRIHSNVNPPITSNDTSVSDVKTPFSVNTEPFQIKAPKADDGEVVVATQVSQQIRQPLVRRGSSTFPKNDRNTSRTVDDAKCSETLECGVTFPSAQVVPTGIPRIEVNTAINSVSNKPKLVMSRTELEAPNTRTTQKQAAAAARLVPPGIPGIEVNKAINSISNKPKLVKSRTGLEAPNTRTTPKQAAEAQEPSQAKLVSETSVDEGDLETAGVVKPSEDNAASVSNRQKSFELRIGQEPPDTQSTQKQESAALESCEAKLMTESSLRIAQTVNPGECGNPGDSTCEKPSSSESIRSDKQEEETKDGQLQQKTMSVMRGGEMVQVSYQVYIPKRAAALGRRQLKR